MRETKFKYLSQQHGSEIKQALTSIFADGAEMEQGVFINAPCGCGKTFFVMHDLVNYAKTYGHKILLLVSRKPLKDQLSRAKTKRAQKVLTITTYQAVQMRDDDKKIQQFMSKYDIIVCDEGHYFVSDSVYIREGIICLQRIFAQPAVKIFMTATPIPTYMTLSNIYPNFKFKYKFKGDMPPVINDVQFFYDNFDGDTEADIELLLAELDETEDKAIIFCSSIKMAHELYTARRDQSIFLCSQSSDKGKKYQNSIDEKAVKEMLTKEHFNAKYLFTTTVAEVGITIKDKAVKHIVCCLQDWNSIVQALGRKRMIDDTDTATAYLTDRTAKSLNGTATTVKKALQPYNYFDRYGTEEYLKEYPIRNDNSGILIEKAMQPIKVNQLALAKWQHEESIVKSIQGMEQGNDNYRAWVYKQLNMVPQTQRRGKQIAEQLRELVDVPFYGDGLRNVIAPKINYRNEHGQLYTGCETLDKRLADSGAKMTIEKGYDKKVRKYTYTVRKIA